MLSLGRLIKRYSLALRLSSTTIIRKEENYTVTFKKEGYDAHSATIKRGLDGWYILGNLVFGGVIGYLIVDPATGAMWKLEEKVSVYLKSQVSSLNSNQQTLKIVLLSDVPKHLVGEMVPINLKAN